MEENNKRFGVYFHGRMSDNESLEFQSSLKGNPNLKSDYEFYESVKRASSDIRKDELRGQLEEINLEEEPNNQSNTTKKEKVRSTKIFTLIKFAVAIAALFFIGFWGYQDAQKPDIQGLYAQKFETFVPQQSRGENIDLSSIDRNNINTPELKLWYSTILLSENKTKEAISTLNEINDKTSFRDQKYWYLGLSNLKTGNFAEAKKHFAYLRSISNFKKQEITEILLAIND
ncbi:MAG: hypothetical protein ACI86M_003828 [Saprospiraceae bacterium]|jgi:hypothetical protein